MFRTTLASAASLALAFAPATWAGSCPMDLTQGLIAYWPFDDGSGPVARDAWSGAYPGVVVGATWSAGHLGNGGLKFNGNSNFVEIGTSFPQFDGVKPFSLAAWAKPASFGTYRAIAGRHHVSGFFTPRQWEVLLSNNGNLGYTKVGANPLTCLANVAMSLNQWQHIAVTFDGATRSLYRNGVLQTTCAGGTSPTAASIPVRLGAAGSGGTVTDFFHGELDEVAIYSRALSGDEILALMCGVDSAIFSIPDLNGDCHVDSVDLGIILSEMGCTGPACCRDMNGDGVVDVAELGLVLAAWTG